MGLVFEYGSGNVQEIVKELHDIWESIYSTIGFRPGMGSEALRFGATLRSSRRNSKPFGEEQAVEELFTQCSMEPVKAIEVSKWILEVTKAADQFMQGEKRSRAVIDISQARLLAMAIVLRGFERNQESELLEAWEKVSFRIFGLCRKDARSMVGHYSRLAWNIVNEELGPEKVLQSLQEIGSEEHEHNIDWASERIRDSNCYEGWENSLRYLLYRYEEKLSRAHNQEFDNEQWGRIWEASPAAWIKRAHLPSVKGKSERTEIHICPSTWQSDVAATGAELDTPGSGSKKQGK